MAVQFLAQPCNYNVQRHQSGTAHAIFPKIASEIVNLNKVSFFVGLAVSDHFPTLPGSTIPSFRKGMEDPKSNVKGNGKRDSSVTFPDSVLPTFLKYGMLDPGTTVDGTVRGIEYTDLGQGKSTSL